MKRIAIQAWIRSSRIIYWSILNKVGISFISPWFCFPWLWVWVFNMATKLLNRKLVIYILQSKSSLCQFDFLWEVFEWSLSTIVIPKKSFFFFFKFWSVARYNFSSNVFWILFVCMQTNFRKFVLFDLQWLLKTGLNEILSQKQW